MYTAGGCTSLVEGTVENLTVDLATVLHTLQYKAAAEQKRRRTQEPSKG